MDQDSSALTEEIGLGTNFDWNDVVYFRGADRRTIHRKGCTAVKRVTRWEYARSHLLNNHQRVLQAIEEFNMLACSRCMGEQRGTGGLSAAL